MDNICEFCGQVMLEGDDCDCDGAKKERLIKMQIANADQMIDKIFGDECTQEGYMPMPCEIIQKMHDVISYIARKKIYAVTYSLPGG